MEMQKPYDGQVLLEALKKEGVEGGIETAKKVVSVMADFLRSSAELSKDGLIGKLDDIGIPIVNYFEKAALDELSKLEAKLESPAVELEKAPEAAPSEPVQDPSAPQS